MPYATVLPLPSMRGNLLTFISQKNLFFTGQGMKESVGVGSWDVTEQVEAKRYQWMCWDGVKRSWSGIDKPLISEAQKVWAQETCPLLTQILCLLEENQELPWPGSSAGSHARHLSYLTLQGPWHFGLNKQVRPGLAPSAQAETEGAD